MEKKDGQILVKPEAVSKSPVPVELFRMHLIPPTMTGDNVCIFYQGSSLITWCLRFYWAGHENILCLVHTKISGSQKESRCSE